MILFKLLLPLIAAVQNPLLVEDDFDPEDQISAFEDPSEIYEIEFADDDEDEDFLEVE